MPKLDARLKAVARQISGGVHADIGSDHGHLLKALLASGRVRRGIAVENKRQPLEHSRRSLTGMNADIRYASGLDAIGEREIDSVSLCGMGGELIARLLREHPQRVPQTVVVQPNRCSEAVRRWALDCRYHLVDEQWIAGKRPFVVLRFLFSGDSIDPAYDGLDREAAEWFGPLLLRKWEPHFVGELQRQRSYLLKLGGLTERSRARLEALNRVLDR